MIWRSPYDAGLYHTCADCLGATLSSSNKLYNACSGFSEIGINSGAVLKALEGASIYLRWKSQLPTVLSSCQKCDCTECLCCVLKDKHLARTEWLQRWQDGAEEKSGVAKKGKTRQIRISLPWSYILYWFCPEPQIKCLIKLARRIQ